jgi:hypothetical protein
MCVKEHVHPLTLSYESAFWGDPPDVGRMDGLSSLGPDDLTVL